MPVDFVLTPGADERIAARTHLDALSPGDIVVLDRGHFSFAMLHAMTKRGLHPVFRIQRNAVPAFDRFRDGDARVGFAPGHDVAGSRYVLATTLADPERYSVGDLSWKMGNRRTVQGLQAPRHGRQVPRPQQAGRPP